MTTNELTEKVNILFGALYDISIEVALSNTVEIDWDRYPEEFHKYIEKYMGDDPANAVAATVSYLFENHYLNDNIKR